jgi:hypothetical protein
MRTITEPLVGLIVVVMLSTMIISVTAPYQTSQNGLEKCMIIQL